MPEQRRAGLKALGDRSYTPESQTIGTYNTPDNFDDLEVFSRLAKRYVFDGPDRQRLCAVNAQVGVARSGSFTTSAHLIPSRVARLPSRKISCWSGLATCRCITVRYNSGGERA